jgi:hypothetical protein
VSDRATESGFQRENIPSGDLLIQTNQKIRRLDGLRPNPT